MNNKQKSGQIQVIFGPMFSGKTTELLRRIRRYTIANRSCLVIKYKNDTRYSNEDMATHDMFNITRTILLIVLGKCGQHFPQIAFQMQHLWRDQ